MNVDWGDVQQDMIIQGKDGKPWTIMSRDEITGQVWLQRDDGARHDGIPTGSVVVLAPSAIDLVQTVLGGEETARKGLDGIWRVPHEYTHPGALRAHTHIFHGTALQDTTDQDLQASHAGLHRERPKVPHIHDPRWRSAP